MSGYITCRTLACVLNYTSRQPKLLCRLHLPLTSTACYQHGTNSVRPPVIPKRLVDINNQSRLLPGPERIRTAQWGLPNPDDPTIPMERYNDSVTTVYENFLHGAANFPKYNCLGKLNKDNDAYSWITYEDARDYMHSFGAGLIALGAKPGQDTPVGIYCRSCPEWDVSSIGSSAYSMPVVSIYDAMGFDGVLNIINQSGLSYLVVENCPKAERLLGSAADVSSLKHIIIIEDEDVANLRAKSSSSGISLHSFWDIIKLGQANPQPVQPPKPEDTYIICYTSGTTGAPKGAVISHRALVATVSSFIWYTVNMSGIPVHPDTGYCVFSFLPPAHMFEQNMHSTTFYFGGPLGYFRGDVNKIAEDAQLLKPGLMAVVPRLLNRLHDEVQNKLAKTSPLKRAIFNWAYRSKFKQLESGVVRRDTIWDRLVFRQIQEKFGGNIEIMITGAAPVSEEVLNFCRVVLSCQIIEGYGQTECCACASATLPMDMTGNHVGAPVPSTHIKLADVPEMNYWSKDDEGEILIRGTALMDGYYKDTAMTKETVDDGGWLQTGDIGKWLPNGALRIIDRKKHLLKLSQGEYVAPEKVETVLMRVGVIEQIFVEGDSLQDYLVAVIVPFEGELRHLTQEMKISEDLSFEQLCQDKRLESAILGKLEEFGKTHGLSSLETVKAIRLIPERFSVDNELLTPTLKNKRPQLRDYFHTVISELYRE